MYLLTFLVFGSVVISISDGITTVYKCCPKQEILTKNPNGAKCEKSTKEWIPEVVSNDFTKLYKPEELKEVLKFWDVQHSMPKCEESQRRYFTSVTSGNRDFLHLANGSLWFKGVFLHTEQFCVDDHSAIVCVKEESSSVTSPEDPPAQQVKRVYINKCCSGFDKYSDYYSNCLHSTNDRKINVTQFLENTTSLHVLNITNTFLDYRFPTCDEGYIKTGRLSEHNSSLQQDGSLYLPTAKVLLEPKTFCLEYIHEKEYNVPTIFTCPNYIPMQNHSHIAVHQDDLRLTIYPLGLFISAFFLAATLATGCLLPTTHHMLHWRCQTCHVACLMVGDLLLAITHVAGNRFPHEMCTAFASIMHVLFLAAFFWLNTMCFNIWWTFRDLRPSSLDKGQEAWRLRMYELYAWGCPLIIAGTAAVLDNLPQDNLPSVLRPKFADLNCWFPGHMEILTYFFGPIGILLFLNLILFVLTARELTCGLWRSEVVKSTTERATLGRVCLKLVVVMGITWIFDIASWAAGGSPYLWYLTDIVNSLHGIFIFIVVGCQPQIWAAVKRLWCFKETTTTSVNGNPQSCSQDVPSMGDSVSNNTNNTSVKMAAGETPC